MDINTSKTLIKAGSIVALVCGIIMCITIAGAVVGIPLIIGYKTLIDITSCSDEEFKNKLMNNEGFGWSIFILIACFPIGALCFVPYLLKNESNNSNNNNSSNNNSNNNNSNNSGGSYTIE